jgi:predicted metal-dependent peptidase
MNVLEDISKITVKLLIKESFYGHFFTHIHKRTSEQVNRVAISVTEDKNIVMIVNPRYWQSLKDDAQKMGCIKHQILHVVFKHGFRVRDFGNKEVFHVAADLVVNQYLEKKQLMEDAISLYDFAELELLPHQSVSYYYQKLMVLPWGAKAPKRSGSAPEATSHGPEEEHRGWDQISDLAGAETQYVADTIDAYLENSAQRINTLEFGLLPAELQTLLKVVLERFQATVSWKRMLKLFSESSRKTYVQNTLKRSSKRYGTVPGIKIRRKQKLLIAVDTSGSIEENELADFFGEIYHIWKQSAEVMIVECDAAIQNQYLYKGQVPVLISGGGGTCFDPPIGFANTSYHPDALIYFTDGHGPDPLHKSRVPILWMITSKGVSSDKWDHLPGRKIKLPSAKA